MKDISAKVEAAYSLSRQVELQNLVYRIMNDFLYDDTVTLKDILNDVHLKKAKYETMIDS